MSDARWQRLQALFEGLLERDPAEREAWIEHVEPDAELRRNALSLLAADSGPRVSITRQVREASARVLDDAARVDKRLGPYRLIDEIGSGGMGTVFLAERADDTFHQRVAIKLLRGIPTREATERMRRERQILADLAHPHIARLLDGGSTADGQPYLVMEYVEGVPVNEFCRVRELSMAERLRLVQKVCGAVQFAHQRLVIHRDLKPANVLVRADGEPVLLDFGIAKLLGNTGGDAQTGMPWFTPAYASPEQRRGEAVSTATDVYGLGLLLYECLAERQPQADDTDRLPKPSANATTDRYRIPAELDLIVAKATHAEPERRYVSAAALADDLQRHLRGRPVHAVPDRLHYRVAKFVGRHRLATAAIAAAIVMAVLVTWRRAGERDRALRAETEAREQSATAEHVVDYLVALFHSASPEEAGTKPIAPRELVDRGRKEIDARLAGSPRQQARLLGAIGKIYLELGAPEEAASSLGAAAELERAHGTPERRASYLADQGYALNIAEQPAAAEPVLREGLATFETAARENPARMAEILSTLALSQARNGNPQEGETTLRRALDYARKADGEDGLHVGQSLYALAEVEMRLGRFDDAERDARRSIELLRRQTSDGSPEVLSATGFLTEVYEQQGRYAEGEALLRQMLSVRLRTLAPDSAWAITVRNNLAQAIQLQGRIVEATTLLRQNVDYLRAAGQQDTASYFISLNNLASLAEQAGDYDASIEMFRETLERAGKHEADPHMATYRQNLGRSLLLAGRLDAAWPLLDHDIEGGSDSLDLNIERGRRFLHIAEWMRRSGRLDDAMRYADRASEQFGALYPPAHPRHGAVARIRAAILRDRGRAADAEKELRRSIEILTAGIGKDANATIEAEIELAQLLAVRGASDEAAALISHVGPLLPARFVEIAPARKRFDDLKRKLDAG
ncbi:MAG TPA: tetratricopeptide repeat protein [Rhodanobacteraceae bacterium]|nr:tetratricopeptide repeat protein [Rhodanobacteraceae bacterium]